MALPSRFESYKGFVITPFPIKEEGRDRWTIGGFIRPEGTDATTEESFVEKGQYAATFEEAVDRSMVYGKKLVDARESK